MFTFLSEGTICSDMRHWLVLPLWRLADFRQIRLANTGMAEAPDFRRRLWALLGGCRWVINGSFLRPSSCGIWEVLKECQESSQAVRCDVALKTNRLLHASPLVGLMGNIWISSNVSQEPMVDCGEDLVKSPFICCHSFHPALIGRDDTLY